MNRMILRIVLVLTGLTLGVIGLNTGLGGVFTLGWQFPPDVATVSDPLGFARHDSNARFFAGTFTGLALVLACAGIWLSRLGTIAVALLLAVALGGLARLGQTGYSPLGDAALRASTLAELLVFPLLALWTWRTLRAKDTTE